MRTSHIVRWAIIAVIAAAGLATGIMTAPESRAGTLGGPVILGGDDLTDHGSVDGGGNVIEGWLYIRRALESMSSGIGRGDGSIAALGSAAAPETNGGDAGAAIGAAAEEVGRSVTYYNGDAAINQFFADLSGGSANPSIIWVSGTGAGNDLSDGPGDEPAALLANASAIASFVASGGGLLSHGTDYGWLTALLPGVTTVDGGSSDDLYFTPEGTTALGALTVGDINAGPWHNHFEGDFGGLQVLVRSSTVDDSTGADAAVILGGAQVTFEELPPEEPVEEQEDCLPGVPGLPCGGQSGGGNPGAAQPNNPPPGEQPTVPPPAPTPVPASPVAASPTPTGGRLGTIGAPDTGSGDGTLATDWTAMMMVAAVAALAGGSAAIAVARRLRR